MHTLLLVTCVCVYPSLWSWVIIIFPRLHIINRAPMTYYYGLFKHCDGMSTVCNTAQCPCNHMRHSIPSHCSRGIFRVLIREELCIPDLVLVRRSMNWFSGKTRWGIMRHLCCCNEQGIASIGRLLEPAPCPYAARCHNYVPYQSSYVICILCVCMAQFIPSGWFFVTAVRLIFS